MRCRNKFGMTKNRENMIPYFVIDQITLGPIKLYTWGLFVGLGFGAGYLWFYYLARQKELAPAKIAGLALAIFAGAILGAKILAWALAGGGAMFMGGLLGAIVCGWKYVKILNSPHPNPLLCKERENLPLLKGEKERGLSFWRVADLLVLPTLLGVGIGRIGCILINDHQGAITNLPWGILWPDGIARHPVGIYEMLLGFGLLAVFWWMRKKIKIMSLRGVAGGPLKSIVIPGLTRDPGLNSGLDSRPFCIRICDFRGNDREEGILFLLFLFFYSTLRFFLDFARVSSGPLVDPRWGILSVSQWLALGIIFIVGFYWGSRKRAGY